MGKGLISILSLVCVTVVSVWSETVIVPAPDFEDKGTFYIDGSWLAVTPGSTPVSASATTPFTGSDDTYDITIHTVGENDGNSSYTVWVDGDLLGEFINPPSTETFEEGEAWTKTWTDVSVSSGSEIKVQATTASKDGEWARGRWSKIVFVGTGDDNPVDPPGECVFNEEDGLVIMEIESAAPNGWDVLTEWTGFTGESYYKWTGSNYIGSPPGIAELKYTFNINNPGTYQLIFHCRHDHPDCSEENDHWLKIGNEDWYKTGNHQACGSWGWQCWQVNHNEQIVTPYVDFDAGEHTIAIQPRSYGFAIDRLVLQKGTNGDDTSLPQSSCVGGSVAVTRPQSRVIRSTMRDMGEIIALYSINGRRISSAHLSHSKHNSRTVSTGVHFAKTSKGFIRRIVEVSKDTIRK